MKKFYLLIGIVSFIFFANSAMAQNNVVRTNVLNFALAGGSLHYERTLFDAGSLELGVYYSSVKFGGTGFSGLGITPQFRFYPGKNEIPHGFFLAPLLSYQNFGLSAEATNGTQTQSAEANYTLTGAGVDIGKQWLIARVFSIELSTGLTFNATNFNVKTEGYSQEDFSTGNFGSVTPRAGVEFGVAF